MKRLIGCVLPLCMILLAASCDKDKKEKNSITYEMEDIVIPMTFDTFTSKDDVVIENEDTSLMCVRKSYLDDVLQKEVIDGFTYLAVWLAQNQYPFYRKVERSWTESSDDGDLVHMETSRADVSKCLSEGEYKLCTSIFVNERKKPRLNDSDGPINPQFYFDESTHEYHPVAMFVDIPDENIYGGMTYPLEFGDGASIMIEDMMATKGSVDPSITMKIEAKDKYIADTSSIKIGLEKFIVDAGVQLHIAIDVGVKWASKKVWLVRIYYPVPSLDEFKAVADAHFDADMKLVAKAKVGGELPEKFQEFPICTFANVNVVFFVGPVPVIIDCAPQLILGCNLEGAAGAGIYAEGKVESSLEAGGYYENGWHKVWNTKCDTQFSFGAEITGDLEAYVGLFVKVPVKIDKLVGPYVKVGPRLEGEVHGRGYFDLVGQDMKGEFEAKAGVSVGGEFGAEIKFMSWNIAKWTTRFDAWRYDFLDYKYPPED